MRFRWLAQCLDKVTLFKTALRDILVIERYAGRTLKTMALVGHVCEKLG
jgi:hypothetical protein